ncbi:MAG TPA: hypothetical protein PK239_16855 [Chitinophagales bacterium]|nr:hypothetical protein [Chitinophagales bacterium]HRK28945.1 hypothetical protein [Chitinophagales bacterium]
MKKMLFLCFTLLLVNKAAAQPPAVYDAQFGNPQAICSLGQFCATLQLKAASGQPDFAIGSHTLFFSYNKNVINNPVYTSIHFNNTDSCALGGFFAPYFAPSWAYDPNTGEFNLTTNMLLSNQGCPLLTQTNWTDVGTVCFQIVGMGNVNLQYNPTLTLLNLNDNTPEHVQGALFPLSLTLDCPPIIDSDADGLTDAEEEAIGTSPILPDTDGDGLTDGQEVNIYGTNPLSFDTDEDGIADPDELLVHFTNPLNPDTDNDGLTDWQELFEYNTNPTLPDTDNDGLTDGEEVNQHQTNPLNPDTDADTLTDGAEVYLGSNPLNPDTDADSVPDAIEAPNAQPIDTDNDGILDILDTDDDNDTIPTILEDINQNANPTDDDTNQNGIPNYLDNDDDGDGILTQYEDANNNGNLFDDDDDGDGIPDFLDPDAVNIPNATAPHIVQLVVFPNPATQSVFIALPLSLATQTGLTLQIAETSGKTVWSAPVTPNNQPHLHCPTDKLASGIYTLYLYQNNLLLGRGKFVKE